MNKLFTGAFNAVVVNGVVKLEKAVDGKFTSETLGELLLKLVENKELKAFDRWSFYIEGVNEKLTDPKATLSKKDLIAAAASLTTGEAGVTVQPNRYGKPVVKFKSAKATAASKPKSTKIIIE